MRDVEIPNWLKGLPLAPEYRPTETEFADPIAYISKIEKEASTFGICKVIPPLPKPSKKYVMFNLNRSLSKSPELGPDVKLADVCSSSIADTLNETNDGDIKAVFTTRQQELGQNAKTSKKVVQPQSPAVRKQVWQSGEVYTLEQFELKSKAFARCHLGMVKEVSPLVVETLFWEATSDKPIYVEYANDVPGSGFGEPEGSFHYFNSRRKRRRRRTFRRSCGGSSDVKKYLVDMSYNGENIEVSTKNSFNSSIETSEVSASLPAVSSNQASQFSVRKTSNTVNEMEGTAGWKLSNSPWNLQVIARSPGSLTRFMPDDIPGVTSPMVYIGMLFSWFAWHVEDHELHSMNFLHTGSPKTWYAIPGDYAFDFEEVIRSQAYGTNIDRLAALTMLGEKTTLLSPEAVLGSGIPCCRLVQNPGEFVVTFPRAYHVGFSHGFNCGEAANFGTPKWLKVAKEAAVRRAAMNYLPMLSHQQLLYLLTMSFVSRVPRSLLPGARSSRLRDRQKEEREKSVKKAFIEDILSQNNLLTTLLGKNSSYHVVLWDLDSLPSPSKVSEPCSSTATVVTTLRNGISSENKNNQDLLCEMSLYMETMNSLYMEDDDLSDDFQVDSGSLACVACGVLGFPFMSVVQPSERASVNLLQDVGVPKSESSHSSPFAKGLADGLVSDGVKEKIEWYGSNLLHHSTGECHNAKSNNPMVCSSASMSTIPDPSPRPEDLKVSSEPKIEKGWCATTGFLRPRIFCLEHAIQIEDLLHSRGGANILVICHSDFKKMKPHAAVTAEQIGCAFRYNEVPLDNASQEDLSFIDLSIDDEDHDASGEDWTSKLSINLRHCVRTKKSSPAKSVQHALALGGLFFDATPSSNIFDLKWPSKKSRSKRNLNDAVLNKPSDHVQLENPGQEKTLESVQMEKDEMLGVKSDVSITRKEGKLIQYTRSRLRNKLCGSAGKESSGVGALDSNGCYELQHGGGVSVSSQTSDLLIAATPGVGSLEAQIEGNLLEGVSMEGKASDSITEVVFETQHEMEVDKHGRKNDNISVEGFFSSQFIAAKSPEYSQIQREINILEEISTADVGSIDNSQGWIDNSEAQCSIQSEGNVSTEEASDLIDFVPSCGNNARTVRPDAQRVEKAVEVFGMNTELLDSVVEQEIQGTNGHEEKESSSSLVVSLDRSPALSKEGILEVSMGIAPELNSDHDHNSSPDTKELKNTGLAKVFSISSARNGSKRRKMELQTDAQCDFSGFIKSPCEGLRPRSSKNVKRDEIYNDKIFKEKAATKNLRKPSDSSLRRKDKKENRKGSHRCDLESCRMSFQTKEALLLHKRNRCPHEGCGKKFSSHKYAMLHQRVHDDDRPLKCPWKGCRMSFKWAWARTEHLRVHTGERPYHCKVEGCGLTFRFVSDYSRHRRKTGHYVTSPT